MKLLLDHNLSHKLVRSLEDCFPDSTHTRLLGMEREQDVSIWEYAKLNDFIVTTLDKDFADLAIMRGAPPKVIWLRCGNSTVSEVDNLLRRNLVDIIAFDANPELHLLEIWP